jgi:serine/threonine protein kinase
MSSTSRLDTLSTIPFKSELVSESTSSAIITRLFYPDNTSIIKRAKQPIDDIALQHEYRTLFNLGAGENVPEQIPQVFREIPGNGVVGYAFEMEDILGQSLLDLVDNDDTTRDLSLLDRLDILSQAGIGLSFANRNNLIHSDVQLKNIIYDRKCRAGKVIDWSLAQVSEPANELVDVTQFAGIVEAMMINLGGSIVPKKLMTWSSNVLIIGKYSNSKDAWDDFFDAITVDLKEIG